MGTGCDGAHGAEGVTGGESWLDGGEEAAGGVAGDDIEGDEVVADADEVLVVGIEDAEVVLAALVGAIGDFPEAEGGEPCFDFRHAHRDDFEARLGGDDGEVAVGLMK